jgi:hypothetical protein
MCVIYGEKHARIAIASRSTNEMDGQEMDDECIFIDYFNGQKISSNFPEPAMNHTRNTLVFASIKVIME